LNLKQILKKKKLKVIGLMSGTSANGIDACLAELENKKGRFKIKLLGFKTYEYPDYLRKEILKVSEPGYQNIDEIIRLDFLLGEYFALAAKKTTRNCGLSLKDIDLLGSHGQTVRHLPFKKKMGPYQIRGTLQIGEPQVISVRTGILTIADFRRKDIAHGREGAPLTPLAHFYLFNKKEKNQAVLNIGGITNLTFLPKGTRVDKVWGRDAGPGNMLIDNLMRRYFQKNYDENGKIAFNGKIIQPVLALFLKKIFLLQEGRKSLGREDFDQKFTQDFVRRIRNYSSKKEDLITTISELTARSVYISYKRYIEPQAKIEELILCGGGAKNRYLYTRLKELFYPAMVYLSDELGQNVLAVESLSFALFAFITLSQLSGDDSNSFRIEKDKILGKICLP
jgi:anhydro-N-acetylmuramic acid kinase